MNNDGIEAGLKYWLVFLLAFFFLGYPVQLSILLSALAAIAGGFIALWWKSKDLPIAPDAEKEVRETLLGRAKRRFGGLLRRKNAGADSSFRAQRLGRKPRRSLRSRR
jgi:hypothetical protein